jgi:hypothetical protein
MNLRKVNMKYGRLVVVTRHDSAEIWGFRYGLTLFIGTLKVMASTSVFVRVVRDLKRSIKNFPSAPSITLTYIKHKYSYIHQKMGHEISLPGEARKNCSLKVLL